MQRSLALLVAVAAASGRLYEANKEYVAFPNLDCDAIAWKQSCSCDTVIKGSTVYVTEGHKRGTSTLECKACAGLGLTPSFDSTTGVLRMLGSATVRQHAQAIASVVFKSKTDTTDYRVSYNFGQGVYSSDSGHFYDFHHYDIPCPDDHCHWGNAQEDCAAQENDILGLIGYLVTVTSKEENDFATQYLHAEGWIGAADFKEETWRWVTGPEGMQGPDACAAYDTSVVGPRRSGCDVYPLASSKQPCGGSECDKGLLIGTGNPSSGSRSYTPSSYDHWDNFEPNNYERDCPGDCLETAEDYGHFLLSGNWNDYPYTHDRIEGYVCEWGGIGELCLDEDDLHGSTAFVQGCDRYKTEKECKDEQPGECMWSGGTCFPHTECTCSKTCANC